MGSRPTGERLEWYPIIAERSLHVYDGHDFWSVVRIQDRENEAENSVFQDQYREKTNGVPFSLPPSPAWKQKHLHLRLDSWISDLDIVQFPTPRVPRPN